MSLLPQSTFSTQENEINLSDILKEKSTENTFISKKRLIKKREIIKEKKKVKKIATSFFDNEAELGSDNEEHDDVIKKINSSDEESSDSEKIIEGLINDNEVKKNEEKQSEKYFDDMLDQDKEEIKKVIDGPQRRTIETKKQYLEIEEGDLPLKIRIERMVNEKYGEDEEISFKSLATKIKKLKKQAGEEQSNEEIQEALNHYHIQAWKKASKLAGVPQKEFKDRIKEDDNILKNVVNLNKKSCLDKNKKSVLSKGNGSITKAPPRNSMRFGMHLNNKNSVLRSLKVEASINECENLNANIDKGVGKEKTTVGFSNNFKISRSNLAAHPGNLTSLFIRK